MICDRAIMYIIVVFLHHLSITVAVFSLTIKRHLWYWLYFALHQKKMSKLKLKICTINVRIIFL